jgi:hypothetical protein
MKEVRRKLTGLTQYKSARNGYCVKLPKLLVRSIMNKRVNSLLSVLQLARKEAHAKIFN